MKSAFDAARASLSPPLRLAIERVLSSFRAVWRGEADGTIRDPRSSQRISAYDSVKVLISRIGLDKVDPQKSAASALNAEQRAVLTLLSEDEIPLEACSRFPGARARRRWLGIDAPGILESRGTAKGDLGKGLPPDQQVEVQVEALLGDYPGANAQALFARDLPAHAAAAAQYALRTLPTIEPHTPHGIEARVALFTALARSKTPIPPPCDQRLPLVYRLPTAKVGQAVSLEYVREHVLAIPEARRANAVMSAMRRSTWRPEVVLEVIAHLLKEVPMPPVLEAAQRLSASAQRQYSTDARMVGQLMELDRVLTKIAGAPSAPRPGAISLHILSRMTPKNVSELDDVRRAQLRLAGRRYDGKNLGPEIRLGEDGVKGSFGGVVELRVLEDASGERRIDAWLYAGDGGTYFESGTTTRLAERIQGHVEMARAIDLPVQSELERCSERAAAPAKVVPAKPVKAVTKTGVRTKAPAKPKTPAKKTKK